MPIRQRVITYGIPSLAAATVALAFGLHPWRSAPSTTQDPQPVKVADKHRVDLVFAIDTTSSMSGLIDGAKRTVWAIASQVKQVDPNADLHVGLVAYRDLGQGDEYVTKDVPMSGDLDAIHVALTQFQAEGGGDAPEDVAAGLYDAVHKMEWRDDAKKLMFLVGDAAPADRGEVPRFDAIASEAWQKGITINAIRCGHDPETETAWRQIAILAHGQFSTINANGGVQQVATPYDRELAEASAAYDGTAVIEGADNQRAYQMKMDANAAAPAATNADRAGWYGAKGSRDDNDATGKAMAVGGEAAAGLIAPSALPADMQGMDKAQVAKELDARVAKRKVAQQKIDELNKKRGEYLNAHAGSGSGFDAQVKATVTEQLK